MKYSEKYDLIVVGAGVAGVAAAIEAARAGIHVCLLEKTIQSGGLATNGLINIYLPLCDGYGNQVIYGIAEELLHASILYGPGNVPAGWPGGVAHKSGRYLTCFSPASFALALDEILEKEGVDIWFDTLVCQTITQNERVTAVEVENKSGRGILSAKCFIDTTGDADVAYHAGAPYRKETNQLSLWGMEIAMEHEDTLHDAAADSNPKNAPYLHSVRIGSNKNNSEEVPDTSVYDGVNSKEISAFVLKGHRKLREKYAALYAADSAATRHTRFPVALPGLPQLRTTRCIHGRETVKDNGHSCFIETSIGCAPDWRKNGCVYEIPYGALLPQKTKGILVAGRCISSETDAWEVTRIIPVAALTGQVAGIAATLAVERNILPHDIDVSDIQQQLEKKSMPYHIQH